MAYIARYGRYDKREAITRGQSRLGEGYVWGAWDCSAFVSWCYFNGSIRWTTASMASVDVTPYGFQRLPLPGPGGFKPGDIVYYNTADPENSHTALIINASGFMIQQGGLAHCVNQHGYYNPGWTNILRPKDDIIMVKRTENGRVIWHIPGYQNY